MWPFSYSRLAICIAYLAEKPSLRDASCWSVVVRNGAYGDLRYGLRSTDPTLKSAPSSRSASAAAAAPSRCRMSADFSSPVEPKSRPCATRLPSTATSAAANGDLSCPRAGANSASRYWDLEAEFAPARGQDRSPFAAALVAVDGKRVAQGRDFGSTGELKSADILHLDGEAATALADRLDGADFSVGSVERKPYRRSPYAPFRTTTLQQEASRKLGFSAKYAMQVAKRLYENGHITYIRTDSVTLSKTAIAAARAQARELYGAEYVPDAARVYTSKVKSAQEAHEAIRPAGDSFRTPARTGLSGDEFRLYELVWKRTVASQMKDATGESVSVRVTGTARATADPLSAPGEWTGEKAEFGASGKVIGFY